VPSPSSSDFSALANPGYTPSQSELATIVDVLVRGDEEQAELAARALGRAGGKASLLLAERLPTVSGAVAPRLVRVMGRLAQSEVPPSVLETLLGCLEHEEPRVRRAGIVAIGKLGRSQYEAALLGRWENEAGPERRALAEALGKIGGQASLALLRTVTVPPGILADTCAKARLLLTRRQGRSANVAEVRMDVRMPSPQRIGLICRYGLSRVVEEQLAEVPGVTCTSADRLFIHPFTGSLGTLFGARSFLSLGIVVSIPRGADTEAALARTIATQLLQDDTRRLLRTLTAGTPRLRFSVPEAGHRRALLWSITEAMQAGAPDILVDPEGATWDVWLMGSTSVETLWLVPRTFTDPRFTYRKADVAASSHPTVAAALAHVLGVNDNAVIWDPFVGSGLELIERARLGPYRALFGTDISENALRTARTNAEAASVHDLTLLHGDARVVGPKMATAIISNPPLGSRLVRDGSLGILFDEVLNHAHRILTEDGRLVWLSPMPARTRDYARRLGFEVRQYGPVDIGGLRPELQVMVRHARPQLRGPR
jgi:precorrin-6B methylase 2